LLRDEPTPVGCSPPAWADRYQEHLAARAADEDDASVAGGFFTVAVRPWQVMMQGA